MGDLNIKVNKFVGRDVKIDLNTKFFFQNSKTSFQSLDRILFDII